MGTSVTANQSLRDGDIFLYHGNGWVSKAIRYVDGTEVNHASVFVGDNHVIEATFSGIQKNSIEQSKKGSSWIKVYRLKEHPNDMSPVVNRANWYYGQTNRYGFEQILLLAFLSIIRKSKKGKVFRFLTKIVLERAAAFLLRMTEMGKEVLICSELVYRSYNEAYEGYNDPYSLYMTNWNTKKSMFRLPINVHPESLYALFNFPAAKSLNDTHKADAAYNTVKKIANTMDMEHLVNLDDELEGLLPLLKHDQLDESSVPEVSIEELEGAFLAFASEVHNQVILHSPERKESRERAMFFREKSMTFNSLSSVIDDFVTPGDLYKADALIFIEKI